MAKSRTPRAFGQGDQQRGIDGVEGNSAQVLDAVALEDVQDEEEKEGFLRREAQEGFMMPAQDITSCASMDRAHGFPQGSARA